MKHIKLFEAFNEDPAMEGQIVIGVISEGVDVAVFPAKEANMVWQHLSSLQSDYYMPFRFDLGESLESLKAKTGGSIYLIVDSAKEVYPGNMGDGQLGAPSVNVPGFDGGQALIATSYDLSALQGNETPILIYNQNGEVGGEHSDTLYAVELVEGDQFMEIQSWGQELKTGAMEHFMQFRDDEEEGPAARM
jgi:hypothetical protein